MKVLSFKKHIYFPYLFACDAPMYAVNFVQQTIALSFYNKSAVAPPRGTESEHILGIVFLYPLTDQPPFPNMCCMCVCACACEDVPLLELVYVFVLAFVCFGDLHAKSELCLKFAVQRNSFGITWRFQIQAQQE